MSEIEESLKRITSHSGVMGVAVLDDAGKLARYSLPQVRPQAVSSSCSARPILTRGGAALLCGVGFKKSQLKGPERGERGDGVGERGCWYVDGCAEHHVSDNTW